LYHEKREISFFDVQAAGESVEVSWNHWRLLLLSVLSFLLSANPGHADDFAIRNGDTVVFLGDSITAARTYSKIIENYTLLRFPERKVRFLNVGRGGDTAAGGLERLDRDVFQARATLLLVAYGINDIGWGLKADPEHKKTYLDAIRGMVKACCSKGVRVYICSAAITAADPAKSEEDFLQTMCDEGMALSRSLGGGAIDVQRTMRTIQKKVWAANTLVKDEAKRESLHTADGIHLNDLGQLAMAFAIMRGLGAPADVSSVDIDFRGPLVLQNRACMVSDIAARDGSVEFVRLDDGLPLNYGLLWTLNFRFIPIAEELNRYLLRIRNLPDGSYEVRADSRSAGTFTSGQLAAGVNLASTTPDPWQPGGPWNAQANVLQSLTEARHQLATAQVFADSYLAGTNLTLQLAQQTALANKQLVTMQRQVARPRPYHFLIRPVSTKKD
jgi:lysophospholipase L1-like esterase